MEKFEQGPAAVGTHPAEAVASEPVAAPGRTINGPGIRNIMLGAGAAATLVVAGAIKRDVAHAGTIKVANTPVASQQFGIYTEAVPEALPVDNTAQGMNAFGVSLINAMPGFNATFRQPVTGVNSEPGKLTATYLCPSPTNLTARGAVQSMTVKSGNKADVTFCPSPLQTSVTQPDVNHPTFAAALSRYRADNRYRPYQWGGDGWKMNMYLDCPQTLRDQNPQTTFKYKKATSSVSAGLDTVYIPRYCDEVGRYSQDVSAQVKIPGKKRFKDVGRKVLLINGIREVLGGDFGLNTSQLRSRVVLSELAALCTAKSSKGTKLRIKVLSRFTPNRDQTFAHASDGSSDGMHSYAVTRYSNAKKVCG